MYVFHDPFFHSETLHRSCPAYPFPTSALLNVFPMMSHKAAKTAQRSFPGRSPRFFTFALLFPTFHRPCSRSGLLLDLRQGRPRLEFGNVFATGPVADVARSLDLLRSCVRNIVGLLSTVCGWTTLSVEDTRKGGWEKLTA